MMKRSRAKRITAISRDATHRKAPTMRAVPSIRRRLGSRRLGLTLIELMVVIVILMTLVGGVIPVLSPNNEARKIRAASRGLQTYIMQAQARAARTGRPVGIAFRETSSGSGVALEVFQIEIPPPFTGFSSSSSAIFSLNPGEGNETYFVQLGEGYGESFDPNGGPFVPAFFTKPGDLMEVGNALFQLGFSHPNQLDKDDNDVRWFRPTSLYKSVKLISGSAPPAFPVDYKFQLQNTTHPNSYRIFRQPVNTSESPYTLPAGVAIDMHASGTEGGAEPTLFAVRNGDKTLKQIGIMFSPSGGVDSVYYNGKTFGPNAYDTPIELPITDASRVFLLLARVENVLEEPGMRSEGNSSKMWISSNASDEQLAELQERINWLNMDSRWIVFDARSGRTVVTENTFVDARSLDMEQYSQMDGEVQLPWGQMQEARELAQQMRSGGGR